MREMQPRAPSGRSSLTLGEPSEVLDITFQAVFHILVVFAMYLLFAGHNQPGGGFIAGLVASAGMVLRMITGRDLVRMRLPVANEVVLGVGMVVATGTALVPLLLGNSLLEHHTWRYDVAVLGEVKWTSALFFDVGIFLVVLGTIGTLLEIFAAEGDAPGLPPETEVEP